MKFVSAAHLTGGGTITGDLTIDGELTVSGTGAFAYTEVVTGDMKITNAYDTIGLEINQTGDGIALKINQDDADKIALSIDSEATTTHNLYFDSPVTTTGAMIRIDSANALTTGQFIKADTSSTALATTAASGLVRISHSGNSTTNVNNLMYLVNGHASATGTTGLYINQASTGSALTVLGAAGSGSAAGAVIKLQTAEETVVDGDYLGRIEFQAPLEASGTDAILTGAQIHAEADDTFGTANNETELVFSTASSDAELGSATSGALYERMRIASSGNVGIASTPHASWHASENVLQLENASFAKYDGNGTDFDIMNNVYYDGAYKSIANAALSRINVGGGVITFYTGAAPGSAGAAYGAVARMLLDNNSRISLSNNDSNTSNTVFGKNAFSDADGLFPGDVGADYNVAIGENAMGTGDLAAAIRNVAVGYKALEDITSGDSNIGVGWQTAGNTTIGVGNTAVGEQALFTEAIGNHTTAIGYQTMYTQASNVDNEVAGNTGVGTWAGYFNVTGNNNSFLGYQSGNRTTGSDNTYVGYNAGKGAAGAEADNVGVGSNALLAVTTGSGNVAIGSSVLRNMLTGLSNVAIGGYDGTTAGALGSSTAAGQCVAIGTGAAGNAVVTTAANGTVAVGYKSLFALTAGASNTAMGYQAGLAITVGDNNTVLGYQALSLEVGGQNSVAIGVKALYTQDGGDSDSAMDNIGIGRNAGYYNVTGTNNTWLGTYAGQGATGQSNSNNVGVGANALLSVTTGSSNIAIGSTAMDASTTSQDNIAIGLAALGLMNHANSNENVAIGNYAGDGIGTIDGNARNVMVGHHAGGGIWGSGATTDIVAIGDHALDGALDNVDGTIAIGASALGALTTGAGNTAVGYNASGALLTGDHNTVLGYQAFDAAADTETNNVAIGSGAMGACDQGSDASADIDDNVCIGFNAGLGGDFVSANVNMISNVAIGSYAMDGTGALDCSHNVFVGASSGGGTWGQASTYNTAVGSGTMAGALYGATYNTVIGYGSASLLTQGDNNTVLGAGALEALTIGNNNIALGFQSMAGVTTGQADDNVAIGYQAMSGAVGTEVVDDCVAIGSGSLAGALDSTNGVDEASGTVAIGKSALGALVAGAGNLAIGFEALKLTTGAGGNTAIGYGCGKAALANSANNTVIGSGCFGGAHETSDSDYNTAVGYLALSGVLNNADQNVCMGYQAGDVITTGKYNTIIGTTADPSANSGAYQIAIGYQVTGVGDSIATIGDRSNTASIGLDGSDTSWAAASSDERYKENIETSNAGLSFVNDLRPVTYNWKKAKDVQEELPLYKEGSEEPVLGHEYGETLHGFIAQEVKTVIDNHSELKEGFKMWKEYDSGIQTVADGNLIPMLVKAVQELSAKVEALENA